MIDSSRNKIDFALFCSKHPKTKLTISHDLSKIGADSANEVNLRIVVHPCIECTWEMNQIKGAIRTLKELQNIDLKDENNE